MHIRHALFTRAPGRGGVKGRGGAREGGDANAPMARGDAVHGTHPSGKWRKPWTEPVLALVETRERCEPYERCESSPVDRWRRDSEDFCLSVDDECSRRSSRFFVSSSSPVIVLLLIPTLLIWTDRITEKKNKSSCMGVSDLGAKLLHKSPSC